MYPKTKVRTKVSKTSPGGKSGMAPTSAKTHGKGGTSMVSDGPYGTKSAAGNPGSGMGAKSSGGAKLGQSHGHGTEQFSAGHSRTSRGKNTTGSGKQGLRG